MDQKSSCRKFGVILLVFSLISNQIPISYAQGVDQAALPQELALDTPTITLEEASSVPLLSEPKLIAEVDSFLAEGPLNELTAQDVSQQDNSRELERYDFDRAVSSLQKDVATAVILESLSAENLKDLLALDFEVGILVLHGEIVLFTSGSEDEVGVLSPVKTLAQKASFISHTHPGVHSTEGPSGADINEAVVAPGQEYVLTHQGVYVYNQTGILNPDGLPYSYDQYISQLNQVLQDSAGDRDQVEARRDLNEFIATQDLYNQATEEERGYFRMGGTISAPVSVANYTNVTTLTGLPRPSLVSGSAAGTTLSYEASGRLQLGYDLVNSDDYSGATISFDDPNTVAVETQDLTTLTDLSFGLKGSPYSIKLEIVDINGQKDVFTISGISVNACNAETNPKQNFYNPPPDCLWKVPIGMISNLLDKTKIKAINFIVEQSMLSFYSLSGALDIRLGGFSDIPSKPTIIATPEMVPSRNSIVLSGTKGANTAILINGAEVVPLNSSTYWSAEVKAPEGTHKFTVVAKSATGMLGTASNLQMRVGFMGPSNGTIDIVNHPSSISNPVVTLTLSASGASSMVFSTDRPTWTSSKQTWTSPEPYATTKVLTVPPGDGNKCIYVKYYDAFGNASRPLVYVVNLDTAPPAGTITINSDASFTASTTATLSLFTTDYGTGVSTMSFSTNNGATWTKPEPMSSLSSVTYQCQNYGRMCTISKTLALPLGDGVKTILVKYTDVLGNSAVYSDSIILDTLPPSGIIRVGNGSGYINNTSVILDLSSITDAGAGLSQMMFSADGVTWTAAEAYASTKAWMFSAGTGTKKVYAKFSDQANRWSSAIMATAILDTIPPSAGTLSINSGAVSTITPSVTLRMSNVTDVGSGLSTMSFSTDGGATWTNPGTYSTSKTLTLPSGDGQKTVLVKYADKAGNESAPVSKSIVLDTAPPTGTIQVNGGSAYVSSTSVTLNLSASDSAGVSQMSFSNNGSTWSTPENYAITKSTWSLTSGNGVKTIYVKFSDTLNKWSNPISTTVTLDTTTPAAGQIKMNVSALNPNGALYTSSPSVTLNLNASNAVSMSFSTDGGVSWSAQEPYSSIRTNFVLPATGDPKKTVSFKYYDATGRVSKIATQTITLDTTSNPVVIETTVANYMKETNFSYFDPRVTNPAIEPISGYPYEGYIQQNFTQPTNIGFYALLLANVISGGLTTTHMTKVSAIAALDKMMASLVAHQATIGYKGLMPWMKFSGGQWIRDPATYGQQVMFGDNANLSAALGTAIGALMDSSLSNDVTVQVIKSKMETFLNAQGAGYQSLFNQPNGQFRRGMRVLADPNAPPQFVDGNFHNYFVDEFRSGILFVMLRYGFQNSVYSALNMEMRKYTTQSGEDIFTVAPWDGGAFQMLWPALTMPETDNTGLRRMLDNFVTIALDYSKRNNLPGFLSASYGTGGYVGNAGISQIAVATGQNQSVTSLYTLGAAYMLKPEEIEEFMRKILQQYPGLVTSHGLWEGVQSGTIVQQQIVANVSTFLLGLAGTGAQYMTRYLSNTANTLNPIVNGATLYLRLQKVQAPAPSTVDFIYDSVNRFTWNQNPSTPGLAVGSMTSEGYRVTSNTAGIVAFSGLQMNTSSLGANLSGRKLRISYKSTYPVSNFSIELKDTYGGTIKLDLSGFSLLGTAGFEQTLLIDLPPALGLASIYETIFSMTNTGSLDFTLTHFETV